MQKIKKEIEDEIIKSQNINVYSLYSDKLITRYSNNRKLYDNLIYSNEIYDFLLSEFTQYELELSSKYGVIHGDPVFSNVMIREDGIVNFIDPRGCDNNNNPTVFGDIMYDYAKIYQSVMGYESIVLEKSIDEEYLIKFEKKLLNSLPESHHPFLRVSVIGLFFTLIPLHYNSQCEIPDLGCQRLWNRMLYLVNQWKKDLEFKCEI